MKLDILCVGASNSEVTFTTKAFDSSTLASRLRPMMKTQSRLQASDCVFGFGGGGYIAAVACSRLGLKSSLISQVGLDSPGNQLKSRLKQEDVGYSGLLVSKAFPTPSCAVLRSPSGDEFSICFSGKAQQYERKTLLPSGNVEANWLYIASLDGDLGAYKVLLDWAKQTSTKVVIRPAQSDLSQPRRALKLFARADVIMLDRDDAEIMTHQADPEDSLTALRNSGLNTVVINDEHMQAWAIHDGFVYSAKSPRNTKCVSACGVGDGFGASFAACYVTHGDIARALDFGLVGARSVADYVGSEAGLLKSFPTRTGKVAKKFL